MTWILLNAVKSWKLARASDSIPCGSLGQLPRSFAELDAHKKTSLAGTNAAMPQTRPALEQISSLLRDRSGNLRGLDPIFPLVDKSTFG